MSFSKTQSGFIATALIASLSATPVSAHESDEPGESHALKSNAEQFLGSANPWHLFELAIAPAYAYSNRVSIDAEGGFRYIKSNGIPDHLPGQFPNAGNPNTISEQSYHFRMPLRPVAKEYPTPLRMNLFGVAINGVPFDPGANEFWRGDRSSGWQYEAMYLGPRLGIDRNNAHVQPSGAYHYHGLPTGLLDRFGTLSKPVLLGYAADGFPIYGPYGYEKPMDTSSKLKKINSSYAVKKGLRPETAAGPGGTYNGEFVQDYEYLKGSADLDECNGRYGITPEYPEGIYHYVLTYNYPYVPRLWRGMPDRTFEKHPPRPGQGPPPGAGGRLGPPPPY